MGLATMVKREYHALLGHYVTLNAWPVPAGTGAAASGGVQVTDGTGAWGASVDIIAAAAIAEPHWLVGAQHFTASGAQIFEVEWIGAAAAAVIPVVAVYVLHVTAGTINLGPINYMYPIYRAASAATCCRVGGAGGKSIYCAALVARLL